MRHVIRFLVILGLLLSASALAPLTSATADPTADPTGSPTGSPRSSASPRPTTTPSGGASTPAASTPAAPTPSSAASPTASGTPTATGTPSASPSTLGKKAAVTDLPATTITSKSITSPTLARKATFTYRVNGVGNVKFRCRLVGPGRAGKFKACPSSTGAGFTSGSITYKHQKPSGKVYTFTAQAYRRAVPPATAPTMSKRDKYRFRIYSLYRKTAFLPKSGPSFNDPLAGLGSERTNLTRVIRTINAMPGYREPALGNAPCPKATKLTPGTIRMSAYSMTDESFAQAAIAAHARCISVQVLMNNHLSRTTDPAWRHLEDALGHRVKTKNGARKSFAHRCHNGCRGTGVLHTKMYLFNSTVPKPGAKHNKIVDTVMMGSSNMTSNAADVQWNDLFGVVNRPVLYSQYLTVFNKMKKDKKNQRLLVYTNGKYQTTFWPEGSSADPYKKIFPSVYCSGATGASGVNGHTIVYVNMHAWFGTRGLALARQLRTLYDKGCYVRVLYSFMSYSVYKILLKGGPSRMSVRRTLFSHDGHTAYVYSHFKNIAISGKVGSDTSSWLTYTGSNNFTNEGTHFDEVSMRISSRKTYRSYVNHFKAMSHRLSSSVYANYSEPSGGGRAP